jgi:6-phosphogluconolactonase/glucosamine-6-phosphate isomerase/deaminase
MNVVYIRDKQEAKQEAANTLTVWLEEACHQPTLLLVSGGSALNILEHVQVPLRASDLTVTVLDERLSDDAAVNNFAQLATLNFSERVRRAGGSFIDTRPSPEETLPELAERLELALRQWKMNHLEGVVIATQGIGSDGHTAGIMPYPHERDTFQELFDDAAHWVVGYDAQGKNPYPLRVTVTLPFLRNVIDRSLVFVVGEEKHRVLERVLKEEGSLWETPARITREMKETAIFTDIH